jgi:EAL domain-containing protein (putative c-di-GMP-specific phosphodiesterase class I)
LQAHVRTMDTIARFGGDEFGVLLEKCSPEHASRIAEGVRPAIHDFRFTWGAITLSGREHRRGAGPCRDGERGERHERCGYRLLCGQGCGRNRSHVYEADGGSLRHKEMHWVARVIELLRTRQRHGQSLPLLAVNLSGTSLNDASFVEFVLQSVGEPAIAAALCFEITETAAVTSLVSARYLMSELKGRGCRFALDDFGTGVSSFVYLKSLPVDFLKIDGQFIKDITQDPVDRSMVEAIGKVGRALGIATIAECVESAAVLAELKRIGVDFAQGFHLAQPLPLAQLPR